MGVSLDGVMVPMKDGARQANRARAFAAGQRTKGPAGYQEASTVRRCRGTTATANGSTPFAIDAHARYGEEGDAEVDAQRRGERGARAAPRPRHCGQDRRSWAKDNWTYLAKLSPEGEQRVDFYHALEQLKAAFDECLWREQPSKGRAQFKKNRHVLLEDVDGVEKVIRALVYLRTLEASAAQAHR